MPLVMELRMVASGKPGKSFFCSAASLSMNALTSAKFCNALGHADLRVFPLVSVSRRAPLPLQTLSKLPLAPCGPGRPHTDIAAPSRSRSALQILRQF